jgi:hypothetical protein
MHIHDKFVVVDFNGDNPTVFTGSSNLAAGGETANGDSLVMIEDEAVANMYAIEAVSIFDHYQFRKVMKNAPAAQPFTLWYPGKPGAPDPWWKVYYDKSNMKLRDRYLFADLPLPAGVLTVKKVDWASLAKLATKANPKATSTKTTVKRTTAKKTTAKKTTAKKSTAKKSTAKKATVKKAAAKKPAAKRS